MRCIASRSQICSKRASGSSCWSMRSTFASFAEATVTTGASAHANTARSKVPISPPSPDSDVPQAERIGKRMKRDQMTEGRSIVARLDLATATELFDGIRQYRVSLREVAAHDHELHAQ